MVLVAGMVHERYAPAWGWFVSLTYAVFGERESWLCYKAVTFMRENVGLY